MKEKSGTKVRWSQNSQLRKCVSWEIPWWLGPVAFTARDLGSISGWGIKILQAAPVPKKKKERKKMHLSTSHLTLLGIEAILKGTCLPVSLFSSVRPTQIRTRKLKKEHL